ncbi:hypothetical protein UFOVP482_12 [uncultured Caudovirales phage]|uniref:Uncharacterized protein n=1 Tax=uncultured Caudovirales phage TaxID=2100421 RepID=A0A6J5MFX8_9CAUD|nr:hypothetical protein UFOVP482_12 [uncultured Caudovirales phage]
MSQYVSRKSDAKSKIPTQALQGDVWTTLEVEGLYSVIPTENSTAGALFATYLNITTPKIGGATELVIKWVRDPKGINDATGYETITLKKGGTTYVKDVWIFQAKKGQPVALSMKPNGKATVTTREIKLAIQ